MNDLIYIASTGAVLIDLSPDIRLAQLSVTRAMPLRPTGQMRAPAVSRHSTRRASPPSSPGQFTRPAPASSSASAPQALQARRLPLRKDRQKLPVHRQLRGRDMLDQTRPHPLAWPYQLQLRRGWQAVRDAGPADQQRRRPGPRNQPSRPIPRPLAVDIASMRYKNRAFRAAAIASLDRLTVSPRDHIKNGCSSSSTGGGVDQDLARGPRSVSTTCAALFDRQGLYGTFASSAESIRPNGHSHTAPSRGHHV